MVDLKTTYAGLELANPLIVSSSGLTDTVEKIRRLAGFDPGAIVLKSLFEEQIIAEATSLIGDYSYPEANDYIRSYSKSHSVGAYLDLVGNAKKNITLPVIASINCISGTDWVDFARQIEEAGADALELNVFILPIDSDEPDRIEKGYFDIIRQVKGKTKLPLIIKISPYFSNLIYMVRQFHALGAKAVVLFNRLYEPDIDLEKMSVTSSEVFSTPGDLRNSLRWVSLVSDKYRKIDISASTGVHGWEQAAKLLLAGAQTIQVCSVLYKNGPEYIRTILDGLKEWMGTRGYLKPDEFRGKMSYQNFENPRTWERAQFMRYFSSRS